MIVEARAGRARALIVDPHVSTGQLISVLLMREQQFSSIGEVATGPEALRFFRRFKPELLITELSVPGMSGPELIHAIRAEFPHVQSLIYSGSTNPDLILAGWEARPEGFAHKTEELIFLGRAISAVSAGSSFFSPKVTQLLKDSKAAVQVMQRLTPKERTVLQAVAEGLSSKEIADRLHLSSKTVEHYRALIMLKLGLRDVPSLTLHAARCGLVTL